MRFTGLLLAMLACSASAAFAQTTTTSAAAHPPADPVSNVTASLPPPAPLGSTATASSGGPASDKITANLQRADYIKGIYVDSLGPTLRTKESIEKLVADCRAAGFNAIFAQVRASGDALYNSSVVHQPRDANNIDALATLIQAAHTGDKKIQVHAIVVPYRVWTKLGGKVQVWNVSQEHPDWLTETNDGRKEVGDNKNEFWLDPGVPAVQDYLTSVVTEIATNYEIDGLHLDRLRYPEKRTAGFNPLAVAQYQKEMGKKEKPAMDDQDFRAWRRDQVTKTLQNARDAVKAAKPNCVVSVGAIAFGGAPQTIQDYQKNSVAYDFMFQDWVGWCKQGLADVLVVADYKASDNAQAYDQWINFALNNKGKCKVVIGVGGWLNPTRYSLAMTLQPLLDPKTDGIALYSYHQPDSKAASAPSQAEKTLALFKQIFDAAALEPKAKDLAAAMKVTDSAKRLDRLSDQMAGVDPAPSATNAPKAPAPTPAAVAAAPTTGKPASKKSSKSSTAKATKDTGLPSLGDAKGSSSPALPSLPSLAANPNSASAPSSAAAGLPSLGSATADATAAPLASLPSLDSASAAAPSPQSGSTLPSLSSAGSAAPASTPTASATGTGLASLGSVASPAGAAPSKPGDLPSLGSAGSAAPASAPTASATSTGLPSLGSVAASPTGAATSKPGDLPSLGSAGSAAPASAPTATATGTGLPSLGSVAASPTGAATSKPGDLPSLGSAGSAAPASAPTASTGTGLPSLGSVAASPTGPAAGQTADLPSLGTTSAQPAPSVPSASTTGLTALGAASAPSAPSTSASTQDSLPALGVAGAPAALPTPKAGDTASLPSLQTVGAGQSAPPQSTLPPPPVPGMPGLADAVKQGTPAPLPLSEAPSAAGASTQPRTLADSPAPTAAKSGGTVSIPDYGPSTNYTGQPVTGPSAASATITPPSVKGAVAGTQGTAAASVTPAAPVNYGDEQSVLAKATPLSGPRSYAPRSQRPLPPPSAVGSASAFESVVLKTGKEFTGRVLERGVVWKVQMIDGSIISLPANKVASIRPGSSAQ